VPVVLEKPEPEGGDPLSENRFYLDEAEESRASEMERVFRYGSVRDMERLMIMRRLAENDQNRTRAAKTLEISVRTIRNKLRLYRELDRAFQETEQESVHSDS
jgi:DNA-binding NtrC family response regulator